MKRILAPSLVLAAALTLSACSDDPGMDMPGMSRSEDAPRPDGQGAGGEAFNHADVMFARMMIPHHEQAIEMSDIILGTDGVDRTITDLATQIKEAQAPEIVQLTAWLDEWGVPGSGSMGMDNGSMGGGSMGGMMTEDDVRALDDAEGPQAGRLFLEGMIVHHQGAIEMAQTEIDNGAHEGTIDLSRSIVESQTREIRTMENLLADM